MFICVHDKENGAEGIVNTAVISVVCMVEENTTLIFTNGQKLIVTETYEEIKGKLWGGGYVTYKEKLEFLNSYRNAIASVQDTCDLIRTLKEKAESTTPNLDGLPHGSGVSDKVGKAAVEIADLEAQLLEEKAESFMRLAKIERVVFNLTGRDRQLIQLKYIEGKSWEEVAAALNYDMFYLMKVRRRIVNGLKI